MLLKVTLENVNPICDITGFLAEDIIDIIDPAIPKVIFYTDGKWAFVKASLAEAHIKTLIDLIEG